MFGLFNGNFYCQGCSELVDHVWRHEHPWFRQKLCLECGSKLPNGKPE